MAVMTPAPRFLLRWLMLWTCLVLSGLMPALASAETLPLKSIGIADQTVCRVVESAASLTGVPIGLLTRLVWLESRFRSDAISPAGAQGIAQFMPVTAAERGLANPFDPEQAIVGAAEFLADLGLRLGNIGLAVAAYNAGPNRVQDWLAGTSRLPSETQAYVQAVTGRSVQDWANEHVGTMRAEPATSGQSCVATVISLRIQESAGISLGTPDFLFQGNKITLRAITAFEQARQWYCRRFDPAWPKPTIGAALRRTAVVIDRPLPPLCTIHPPG
jgi:hypothetical protein